MTRAMYSLTRQPPRQSVFHAKGCRRLSSAAPMDYTSLCFVFLFITIINIVLYPFSDTIISLCTL